MKHWIAIPLILVLAACASPRVVDHPLEGESASSSQVEFPAELRGMWDLTASKCSPLSAGSDTRMHIDAHAVHVNEDRAVPTSIVRVSSSPATWQVITLSNIAPPDVQGDAETYILEGGALTIASDGSMRDYVRCE